MFIQYYETYHILSESSINNHLFMLIFLFPSIGIKVLIYIKIQIKKEKFKKVYRSCYDTLTKLTNFLMKLNKNNF